MSDCADVCVPSPSLRGVIGLEIVGDGATDVLEPPGIALLVHSVAESTSVTQHQLPENMLRGGELFPDLVVVTFSRRPGQKKAVVLALARDVGWRGCDVGFQQS